MAERQFATDGKLGVNPYGSDAVAQHALGTVSRAHANNVRIYVYANEALVSGSGVEMGASFTASATAGGEYTTIYAIASGAYGWVERTDTVIQS